jgi:hypothetical protein
MVSSVEGRPGCLPGRAFLFHHPRIIVSSRTEIPTALTSIPSPQTPTTTDTSRCKMAPHGAETRLSLLVASKDYEKMKARGQKDTSFPYRVEQSIRGGLISVDDDFAKMCLTDERRSVLARQVTKGLGRQMKKQRQKERNQASSARLAIQPQPPLTGVQAMVQPQHLSEHLAGDQVTVSLPQHSTGVRVRSISLEIRSQSIFRSIPLEFGSQFSRSISRSQSSRSLSLELRSQSSRSISLDISSQSNRSLICTLSTPSKHSTFRKDPAEEIARVMVAIILSTSLEKLTASTLPRPTRRQALCRNGERQE